MLGQKGLDLQVGDKVHYRNTNSMIHPEATYEGVITEVYSNYYRAYGTPIRDTMHEEKAAFWGPAVPYYFTIPKYLDIVTDRFNVVDALTSTNENLIKQHMPQYAKYFDKTNEQLSA